MEEVKKKRASKNTKYHILYGYFYQGLRKSRLAKYFGKSKQTVANWINIFNEFGFLPNKKRENFNKKFPKIQRDWIIELFNRNPLMYFDEAKRIFQKQFLKSISTSSIGKILHSYGYTRKVLERRIRKNANQGGKNPRLHRGNEFFCLVFELIVLPG